MKPFITIFMMFRRMLSTLVLGVVYFLLLTPMALLSKVWRADPLQRAFEPERESYWEPRAPDEPEELWAFWGVRDRLWLLPVIGILLSVGLMVAATEGSVFLAFLYPLF